MGVIEKFQNAIQGSRAMDMVQKAGDLVTQAKSSVQGWAGALFSVATNGSTFVGMDFNQVENIRDSIRNYVKNIQTIADGINTEADAATALAGENLKPAVQKYLQAIKAMTDAYVSNLLIYSDKMHEYHEAYKTSEGQLSENVSTEAESLTSQAESTTYTEQY